MQWLRINKYNVVHNGINESFTKGETTYSNCNKTKLKVSQRAGETTVINQSRNSRKMLIEDLPFDI